MNKYLLGILAGLCITTSTYAVTPTTYKYNSSNTSVELNYLKQQKYAVSCELDAASILLQNLGEMKATEDVIYKKIDKSGTSSAQTKTILGMKGKFWGDPELGFVGSLGGNQYKLTGFGVYEQPIERIYQSYGYNTTNVSKRRYSSLKLNTDTHLTLLLKLVESNQYYVQLWGDLCTDPTKEDGTLTMLKIKNKDLMKGIVGKNDCSAWRMNRTISWNYFVKDENYVRTITGLNGEHAFILLGHEGDIENPTKVIVFDTITGVHKYDKSEWLRKWGLLNNRSVIIAKDKTNTKLDSLIKQ